MKALAVLPALAVVAVSVLGRPAPAAAQITAGGSIRGVVSDEQGAVLPGVTVTVTSPSLSPARVAPTQSDGSYVIVDLPPGIYTLSAELQGFAKSVRPDVEMRAGLNLTIELALKVGALGETVEVTVETPLLESEKPVQAVNISGEFQRSLPLSTRRDWSDFLEVTPGVTSRTIATLGTGGQMYLLRGGEIDGHVYQVDGADLGSFRQTIPSYLGLSTEAIADTQVKTGGIDASAPLGTGVVINIATQSGTNVLKGAGSVSFTPRSWNGDNTPSGTSAINEIVQADVALGGPIVHDRAWFFGSYRHVRRNTGISRTERNLRDLRALQTGFTPFDNESRLNYYFVKGSAHLSPNHQLVAFYQRDINPEESAIGTAARKFDVLAYGGDAYAARLSSAWGPATTTRLSVSYNNKSLNRDTGVFDGYDGSGPATMVHERAFLSAGALVGTGTIAQLGNVTGRSTSPTTKLTVQADVTHYRTGLLGSHELQAGVFLQPRLTWKNTEALSNNGFNTEQVVLVNPDDPSAGYVPFRRTVFDAATYVSTWVEARDFAVYIQDNWKPLDRLTVNAGVRIDWIKDTDRLIDTVLQDSVDIGPRFGATYAVTADRRNVLRASWGRIHEQPYAFALPSSSAGVVGQHNLYDNDLNGLFETDFYTPPITGLSANLQVDPDRHMQFTDEWIAGYRRQLPGRVALDAAFVHRDWKDRPAQVEVNGIYENGLFKGYRNEAFNEIYRVTNNRWNWFVYNALELTVSKRTDRLQILGGYTRAFQHIDGTWQPNDPASFIQPDAFPNDRGIGSFRGNETDSYSNPLNTRNSSWQEHQFRIAGTYTAPYGVTVATNYVALSGPYSGPLVDRLAAPDPRFGPATLTLSNGRVVQNPLATTFRFVGPTRGDGQIKAPTLHAWNLRLGRDFAFGTRRLSASLDLLNVTNNGTDQEFRSGGNQRFSPNFALAPDGSFRGQNRQFARAAQVTVRFVF